MSVTSHEFSRASNLASVERRMSRRCDRLRATWLFYGAPQVPRADNGLIIAAAVGRYQRARHA